MRHISIICLVGALALIALSISSCTHIPPSETQVITSAPTSITPASGDLGVHGDDAVVEEQPAQDIGLDELFGDGEGITPPPVAP